MNRLHCDRWSKLAYSAGGLEAPIEGVGGNSVANGLGKRLVHAFTEFETKNLKIRSIARHVLGRDRTLETGKWQPSDGLGCPVSQHHPT